MRLWRCHRPDAFRPQDYAESEEHLRATSGGQQIQCQVEWLTLSSELASAAYSDLACGLMAGVQL